MSVEFLYIRRGALLGALGNPLMLMKDALAAYFMLSFLAPENPPGARRLIHRRDSMNKNHVRSFAIAVSAVSAFSIAQAAPPDVKPSPSTPVQVMNTSANPVPVTGSVAVTGISDVNVTNTTLPVSGSVNASQSGSWNVGIVGTPTVKVASNPSLVQTPYNNHASGSNCGTDISNQCTVPAGKRLVIEYISGEFEASISPISNLHLLITDPAFGSSEIDTHTFLGYPIPGSGSPALFAFSTPFKLILSAGASYYFLTGGTVDVVYATGYLVDQP